MTTKIRVLLVVAATLVVLTALVLALGNSGPASAHGFKPPVDPCKVGGIGFHCNVANLEKKPPQPQPGVGVPPWCSPDPNVDCANPGWWDTAGGNITLKR